MLDEFTVSLLLYLFDNPNSTTTDVAKSILNGDTERETLRVMDQRIRQRFKILAERGIVIKTGTTPAMYSINPSKATIGYAAKLTFNKDKPDMNGGGGANRSVSIDVGDFMVVFISDRSMIIRTLED